MKHLRHERAKVWGLCGLLLVAVTANSQTTLAPKSVPIVLNVQKLVAAGGKPEAFGMVGLFEVLNGATPIANACPSNSSDKGLVECIVKCDPTEAAAVTLLVRAPGADRVPGYESPVSVEVAKRGCKLDRKEIGFTYKTLKLALGEVLLSDAKLARAVTGRDNVSLFYDAFVVLKPFKQSAPALQELAAEGNPSFERFTRIMQDAEVSAAKEPANQDNEKRRKAATEYSTGTRSIMLKDATSRSLGFESSNALVPITTDPFELDRAKIKVANILKEKKVKTKYDKTLTAEILRTTPHPAGNFMADKDARPMDWGAINRAQRLGEIKTSAPPRKF